MISQCNVVVWGKGNGFREMCENCIARARRSFCIGTAVARPNCRADDLRVPDVDVRVMIHFIGRGGDTLHEVDPRRERREGERLREDLAASGPARQRTEGALYLEVGESCWHGLS